MTRGGMEDDCGNDSEKTGIHITEMSEKFKGKGAAGRVLVCGGQHERGTEKDSGYIPSL